MKLNIPYYHNGLSIDIPERRIRAILKPGLPGVTTLSEQQLVQNALSAPINSCSLADLSRGKHSVLIITSDHTRPVPSRITMPLLLNEVRRGSPNAQIKILIATGFHRATTHVELIEKFGVEICECEDIVVHNAFDDDAMVSKGTMPSGGELRMNKLVDWADLIVAEGFIEPHFFAGFSGGRKSILPGICSQDTIMYNHNAEFIAHPNARTGVLEGNPLHRDMLYAAKAAGLAYILNVAIDADKRIVAAFAGDPVAAHREGCDFVRKHAGVASVKADLVVTSNGGYPLDQNIYQAVKGMTAAECCVNPGGVIIMVSCCVDGHGGDGFFRWFADAGSANEVASRIRSIPRDKTTPDQWESQILARVLTKCKAIIIVSSHVDPQVIQNMHMLHAATFESALAQADSLLGHETEIVVVPDGVGIIIEEY